MVGQKRPIAQYVQMVSARGTALEVQVAKNVWVYTTEVNVALANSPQTCQRLTWHLKCASTDAFICLHIWLHPLVHPPRAAQYVPHLRVPYSPPLPPSAKEQLSPVPKGSETCHARSKPRR